MIWCLPLYVKNSTEAKNWFNWGNKNGITIFPWPDLSFDHIKKNQSVSKDGKDSYVYHSICQINFWIKYAIKNI